METHDTCLRCQKYLENSEKFSIFEKDSQINKCLVYKISHITGVEIVFDNSAKFLCLNCRSVLLQIFNLERDFSEIYVNSYNVEWARAWNGNTDLQVCLDYFAVITYITEYYTKDDTGVMRKIIEMLKNTDSTTLQEKMVLVMNSFITARQMGECEAYYKILPDFRLNDSNISVVFVPTSRKECRSKFMLRVF